MTQSSGNQTRRPGAAGGKRSLAESEQALHEAARAELGLDDFGDPAYLEGLRVLLESYDRESKLHESGRATVEFQLQGILKNRLRVEKAWRDHPEILGQEIRRPIFVLGLPRTGTTALHFLLGQDPSIQVLEYWLAAAPQPRPPRGEWEASADFQASVAELEAIYAQDPSLKAVHLMTADGPEECRHLLSQNFTDDTFDCNSTLPSYSEWYRANDMRATYRRHRDLLKLIGSPTPERRWVLKYPAHMRKLRTILEVYPDACFVQTHRDPAKVLPSLCNLIAGWRAFYEDDVDPREIADWQVELWAEGLEHAMEVRREIDSARFFDLHFRDYVADPVGSVKSIYRRFGVELTEQAQSRLDRWQAENPRGKHGAHRYSIGEFGITEEAVAERFAAYVEHFAVERETSA